MKCMKNLFLAKTIDKRPIDWYNSGRNEKAELCNGSTTDSDSVCWGSNPYSAAKAKNPQNALIYKAFWGFLFIKPGPKIPNLWIIQTI